MRSLPDTASSDAESCRDALEPLHERSGSIRSDRSEFQNDKFDEEENDSSIFVMSTSDREEYLIRLFDIIIAGVMVIALLPTLLIITFTIFIFDRGPILFAHRRVGLGCKTFPCLKFRSMYVGAEERLADILASDPVKATEWFETQKLQDDPRVTAIGAFLRRTSLDELPQLLNVLRGDMSLVGPRPIVAEELRRYGPYADAYFATKPGLTGVWQVSGRSDTSYRRRIAADRLYTQKRNLAFNLRIILVTIPAVLLARGSR